MFEVKFHTSFRHNKITFLKQLWIKTSWEINLTFISKNPFEISRIKSKVINKFEWGCLRMSKKMLLPTPLSNLLITFDLRLKILNGFLDMKFNLIYQLLLIQSFLKKSILLCLNEGWNSISNIVVAFHLTMSGLITPTNSNYISHMCCFTSYHPICI